MISKRSNQENIINLLNDIEKNKSNKIISYPQKNIKETSNQIKSQNMEKCIDEDIFKNQRKPLNQNLYSAEIKEKKNINLYKLKIDNFDEKILNLKKREITNPPIDKKKDNYKNTENIKNTRINKIRNFIQGITNIGNKIDEQKCNQKNEINRSINYKQKNIREFELDSDFDMFLEKPLTDREEKDRLNTILDETNRNIISENNQNFYPINNLESYKYEEGESQDFNEKIAIKNLYNARYQKMEHLFSDRKSL